MKQRWEVPRILGVDALSAGVGDCGEGGTASQFLCAYGGSTNSPTGLGGPHRCANGGYAGNTYGGCVEGSRPTDNPE